MVDDIQQNWWTQSQTSSNNWWNDNTTWEIKLNLSALWTPKQDSDLKQDDSSVVNTNWIDEKKNIEKTINVWQNEENKNTDTNNVNLNIPKVNEIQNQSEEKVSENSSLEKEKTINNETQLNDLKIPETKQNLVVEDKKSEENTISLEMPKPVQTTENKETIDDTSSNIKVEEKINSWMDISKLSIWWNSVQTSNIKQEQTIESSKDNIDEKSWLNLTNISMQKINWQSSFSPNSQDAQSSTSVVNNTVQQQIPQQNNIQENTTSISQSGQWFDLDSLISNNPNSNNTIPNSNPTLSAQENISNTNNLQQTNLTNPMISQQQNQSSISQPQIQIQQQVSNSTKKHTWSARNLISLLVLIILLIAGFFVFKTSYPIEYNNLKTKIMANINKNNSDSNNVKSWNIIENFEKTWNVAVSWDFKKNINTGDIVNNENTWNLLEETWGNNDEKNSWESDVLKTWKLEVQSWNSHWVSVNDVEILSWLDNSPQEKTWDIILTWNVSSWENMSDVDLLSKLSWYVLKWEKVLTLSWVEANADVYRCAKILTIKWKEDFDSLKKWDDVDQEKIDRHQKLFDSCELKLNKFLLSE